MVLQPVKNIAPEWNSNIDGLIEQISQNKCCAFIGAGLSTGPGYPLWPKIIDHFRQITGREIDESRAANWDQIELYRNILGEDRYRNELIKLFGPDGKDDYHSVHVSLCSIPFLSWITTNYDYCLENAAKAASKCVTVQHYPELDPTRLRENHIYHIHGVIKPDNPDELIGSVVLSKRDYEMAYTPNTGLPRFLATISEFYTLVFIGYSLGDADLTKVIRTTQYEVKQRSSFENQIGLGRRRQPKHYILMHNEAQVDQDVLHELGLIPIYYGGDTIRHSELQKLLEVIRKRTTGISYPEPVVYRDMFEE